MCYIYKMLKVNLEEDCDIWEKQIDRSASRSEVSRLNLCYFSKTQ